MHPRCSPLFFVACLFFLLRSPSFAHTPPAPQGSPPPVQCPAHCKCTCPAPPVSHTNTDSPPPTSNTNTGSPPPGPNTNTGSPPPAPNTNAGSPPPSPQTNKGSPPPGDNTNTGSPPPAPNTNKGSPPPAPNTNKGSPPPTPNTNTGSPPPSPQTNKGSPPPAPNTNTGSPPPAPNTNTGSPPPTPNTNTGSPPSTPQNNKGSPPPAPNTNTGSPPPTPQNNKGSPPPAPNTNTGSPPPTPNTNTGSPPSTPPNNKGSPPPESNINTGSPPEKSQNHITNIVNSVHNGSFSMVFAFGDSYTDNGNAQSLNILSSAFSSSLYKSFATQGSSTSTNRCSNGRLIIDFVSEALGLPSPPPYKSTSDYSHGANFAIAGGTSFSAGSFAKIAHNFITKGSPMGTQAQTEWFNQYRAGVCKGKSKTECESHIQNALFWVGEIGLNDYMRALNSPFSLKSITELCTRDIVGLLKVILEGGAKYIVVQGLPPMGCLPFDISQTKQELLSKVGCSVAVNSAITIHNQILRIQIDLLRKQYPDRMILFANFWDAFMMILKNPQKFKFTETFKACCGTPGNNLNFNSNSLCGSAGTTACKDPNNYINWDGIHLTEAMYKQVTDLFLKGGLCQPSFEEMIKKKTGGSVTSSVSFSGGSVTSSSSFSAGGSVSSSSSFTTG